MSSIVNTLKEQVSAAVQALYGASFPADKVNVSPTRKDVEGDYTVLIFPFAKVGRKAPEAIAQDIGDYLMTHLDAVAGYNVVKGFLNIVVSNNMWGDSLQQMLDQPRFGFSARKGEKVMVEYSSPNTNKPLHLGHVRNILLGWSTAQILDAAGYDVVKVQVVNDRGVHICKSMLAWERFGNGETPQSAGLKGDHLIGKYYVLFEQKFQIEYKEWQQSEAGQAAFTSWQNSEKGQKAIAEGLADPATHFFKKVYKNTYFNTHSSLGRDVKAMLQQWENNDPTVRALWQKMNGWVYEGFQATYDQLGVSFDKVYYESDTYLYGKDAIAQGLESGLFFQKEDGSTWCDLTDAHLDEKIVLRSDGTSVYITQDIGTAQQRYQDFEVSKMIYVVGNEQDYHFQVLFEILKRLGEPYADGLYHLSYGMVELPEGKMKSREGTVVDADDLMAEVAAQAKIVAEEGGGLAGLDEATVTPIFHQIGMGALKFFILKVNPRKGMVFNPAESVELQGQTGPFIQYATMRTKALKRRAEGKLDLSAASNYTAVEDIEQELILALQQFPAVIQKAADTYNPSEVANYIYSIAKLYNRFYYQCPVLKSDTPAEAQAFRYQLSSLAGHVMETGLQLLGIEAPAYM